MGRGRTTIFVAAAALLAGGCGEQATSPPKPVASRPPPAIVRTSAAVTSTPSTTTCTEPAGAGTVEQQGPRPNGTMLLTAVSATGDGCVDRLSFSFRPDTTEAPGFRIEYQSRDAALVEDGSGKRLDADGSAFLVVRIDPAATADMVGSDLVFTYKGPRRFKPDGTSHVRELVKSGDFESVVTWAVGLDERRPFSVSTSSSPPQLVVEIG